ncbi:penicillin-binding transpeptidase domain-containing protein [Dictyobacter arantiisoli]|uniref:Penicillin-binding protein transpeptidase domain-containing protein n=1 Tax=Dictyobacter arantiisoli TaxID=2014874 RepID=A0A5A5TIH4_9CHLR|nr:penicillin-binding transpeptidase domain-containing protein [Dictyobacter arantiisoli]GCF10799.1 hypothetical protein KDI_43630 [Dictyobacter arantiisoli]
MDSKHGFPPGRLSGCLNIGMSFLLACILSACMGLPTATNTTNTTKGPIQLYDVHGQLICELHGQDTRRDCLSQHAPSRQIAFQFIDDTLNELARDLTVSNNNLPTTQLKVTTTLDLQLQKQILQKTQQYISTAGALHNMNNAAVVLLDAHSSAIRTLFGGLDSSTSTQPLDVMQHKSRAIGSTLKPFVYASAFELGISPGEVVYDAPFSVVDPSGQTYAPSNYDHQYHGYLSYREALQNNYNIPALKLYKKVGYDALKKVIIHAGMQAADLGPDHNSTPFGPVEFPLLDVTAGYQSFANAGVHTTPYTIESISDSSGHTIYSAHPSQTRAVSAETAFMLTDVLSDNAARTHETGKCTPLLLYSNSEAQCLAGNPGQVRPAAAVGALNGVFKDTITIGYTNDLVGGAWAGNTSYAQLTNLTLQDGAAQIWHDSMQLAEAGKPIQAFPGPPADLSKKTITYPNLTTTDWYLNK